MYPVLAALFFLTLLSAFSLFTKFRKIYFGWLLVYGIFILFFTGPSDLRLYSAPKYKLPWAAGVTRFVAQGNRSFTSHRGLHEYAWDFVMPNGTEILAAREGRVSQVVDNFSGIGLNSNALTIEHADGEHSVYAHISQALVHVGDSVKQGQAVALSGMVGQTVFPHVHFLVLNQEQTASLPVTFFDVPGGLPFAGHFYTSSNASSR